MLTVEVMKNIYLAVDTTTESCSVALSYGEENQSRYTDEPRKHADLVLPMVDQLLAEAGVTLNQLNGIVYCQGPGAFTGLRIGAGVVQGLAFSADVPVLGVSTLATIAQRAFRELQLTKVHAAIDARMGEIYWGSYALNLNPSPADVQTEHFSRLPVMKLQGEECVIEPNKLVVPEHLNTPNEWAGCGTGWVFDDVLAEAGINVSKIHSAVLPHAIDALTLGIPALEVGKGVAAEFALPHYVRNNVAKKKSEQGNSKK